MAVVGVGGLVCREEATLGWASVAGDRMGEGTGGMGRGRCAALLVSWGEEGRFLEGAPPRSWAREACKVAGAARGCWADGRVRLLRAVWMNDRV